MQRSVPSPPEWPAGASSRRALVLGLGFAVFESGCNARAMQGPPAKGSRANAAIAADF